MLRLPRRLAFRTRTILALIALASLALAHTANDWRRGKFGFQKRSAAIAYEQHYWADLSRHAVEFYAAHEADGHRCPTCSQFGLPASALRQHAIKEAEAHERQFRWHALLAGPAFQGLYGVRL